MNELHQIISAYNTATAQGKRSALATVVHIEGSAYRAPGARMLITEDGQLIGAVSGGCLEGDVLRKAIGVMMEQQPLLVTYDTSDDEGNVFGVSLGCNGIIRILLEPLNNESPGNAITLIKQVLEKRLDSVIVTLYSEEKKAFFMGTSLAVTEGKVVDLAPTAIVPKESLEADISNVFAKKQSTFVEYSEDVNAFLEFIAPAPALIIAGAGNDVQPLAQMAGILGWDVSLIDGRPAYANAERFPGCQVLVSKPEELFSKIIVDSNSAILLMSHNYGYDKAVLKQAIATPAKFIGILGPRKKKERLFKELAEEGILINDDQQERIYAPVGLNIGAETAEEIALSIVGEIKAVFAQKDATHLRSVAGQIHQRETNLIKSKQTYAVLILAAGLSKRLGTPKQELLVNGDTMFRNAVKSATATNVGFIVAVVGTKFNEEQISDVKVELVRNDSPDEGMAGSIRIGVHHIKAYHPQIRNILVMLCDQPKVDTAHLSKLIEKHQSSNLPVVASHYASRKLVPAVFDESLFPALLELEGDTGAKHIIESLGEKVGTVEFPEGIIDVDTNEAYLEVVKQTNTEAEK